MVSVRWLLLIPILLLGSCVQAVEKPRVEQPRATADTTSIDALFAPPSPETIYGDQRGEQIRLGYEIVVNTQEYAALYVGNSLNCTNCHLDAGLDPNAASYVGLGRVYPEYQARAGRVVTLADRVNDCFERNLRGKPLPLDSHKLRAVVAYIEWLSEGIPQGSRIQWRGIPKIQSVRAPDSEHGKKVFGARCAFCHGADGQGTFAAPPLWGPKSYTIAADMARTSVAASFIKANMPRTRGWALSDDEAYDVAAYINSQPRADFSGKSNDWPKGEKPGDAPY